MQFRGVGGMRCRSMHIFVCRERVNRLGKARVGWVILGRDRDTQTDGWTCPRYFQIYEYTGIRRLLALDGLRLSSRSLREYMLSGCVNVSEGLSKDVSSIARRPLLPWCRLALISCGASNYVVSVFCPGF